MRWVEELEELRTWSADLVIDVRVEWLRTLSNIGRMSARHSEWPGPGGSIFKCPRFSVSWINGNSAYTMCSQQQRPSSSRSEPALVHPLAAGGMTIVGYQVHQQQERQPQKPERLRKEEGENGERGSGERERADKLVNERASRIANSAKDGKENPGAPT